MATAPQIEGTNLPLAHCPQCRKAVLTYVSFDHTGNQRRRCVHCDHAVSGVWNASADEVVAAGYVAAEPPACGTSGTCGAGCRPARN